MNTLNIACIGPNILVPNGTPISYLQSDYLLDYDCVFVNPTTIAEEFINAEAEYSKFKFFKTLTGIETRMADFKEYYANGGIVILLTDGDLEYQVLRDYCKTEDFNFLTMLTGSKQKVTVRKQNGKVLEFNNTMAPLATLANLTFGALFTAPAYQPLMFPPRTKQAASWHKAIDNGLFIALPQMTLKDEPTAENNNQFVQQLFNICQSLKQPQTQLV